MAQIISNSPYVYLEMIRTCRVLQRGMGELPEEYAISCKGGSHQHGVPFNVLALASVEYRANGIRWEPYFYL